MGITVGELVATLDLDANPFTKNLDRAMRDGEAAGQRMQQVGSKLTRGVTLPLLAAGGAAVKLGTDFDTSFARMVGLAGVSADEIDGLKDSVLDLAGKTAVAPQELADALYDAASAGLTSEQALTAVEVAARGAAAGLGTTGDIVGLVASATASYGAANIDAAKATDILTATIRAGRADPKELAGTLGRILPVAAQLGVSFDQVGGAVAFLSNVFGDTNRTVTALSGFLIKLVSPTQQGREALTDMGTSVEDLQAAIDRDGLMGALTLLREKGFADNQRALRSLFDDIEGFQGALALLNDESGTLNETLAETRNSTGALGEAFEAADTDGRTIRQALVDLQVAAIKAGEVIGPFVSTVASGTSSIADAFSKLPGPAQAVIVAMAGIMAAVGPLTSIAGKLVTNWARISSAFETTVLKALYAKDAIAGLDGGLAGLATRATVAATQLGLAYAAVQLLGGSADHADLSKLENQLLDLADSGRVGGEAADLLGEDLGRLQSAIERVAAPSVASQVTHMASSLGRAFGNTDDDLSQARATIDDLDRSLAALAARDPAAAAEALEAIKEGLPADVGERLVGLLDQYGSTLASVDTSQRVAAGSAHAAAGGADDLAAGLDGASAAASTAAGRIAELGAVAVASFGAQVSYERAVLSTNRALANLSGRGGRAGGAIRDFTKDIDRARRAVEDANAALVEAQRALDDARKPATARDVDQAEIDIEQARINAVRATQRVKDAEEKLADIRLEGSKDEVGQAELDLQDARLSAREAVFAVEDAEQSLVDVRKKGTDQDRAVIEAQRRVEDANARVRDAHDRVTEAVQRSTEAARTAGGGQVDLAEAMLDAKDAALGEAVALAETRVKQREMSGQTVDDIEKQRIFEQALRDVADRMAPGSPLRQHLEGLIEDLRKVPGTYRAQIEADMTPAERTLQEWMSRSRTARIELQLDNPYATVTGFQVRDSGGPILGPRGTPQMVLGHAGEIVLPTHRMGLGEALQHTLGITPQAPAVTAPAGKQTIIQGDVVVQTQDSPRQWFDEGLWRVAG